MIGAIIKSAIILAGAAGMTALLRRQSAAMRHAIWTAGLAGALAIPFFSVALPAWPNRVVGEASSYAGEVLETTILPYIPYIAPATTSSTAPGEPVAAWTIRDVMLGLWLAGAGIGFLLMICGAGRLAWVAFRAEPVEDPRWNAVAEETAQALGMRRRVHLLQNRSVRFLGTWGITSPRVLLPADAETWSDERIRLVLAHEMAHIKRHDWPVQVLAEAARSIYWFNPLFWLACSHLRQESEHACDDTVVRLGAPGTRYAEELLDLTRSLRDSPSVRSPMLAMAQPSHLERRLVALLNPTLNRLAATPWAVVLVASAAIILTLPLAAVRSPNAVEVAAVAPEVPDAAAVPPSSMPDRAQQTHPLPAPEARLVPTQPAQASLSSPAADAQLSGAGPADLMPSMRAAVSRENCPVTPILRRKQANLEKTAALGSGPWHINQDQTIWAWDQPYTAGREINSMWIRPPDVELTIRAHRTGGGETFETTIPSKYPMNYVSATLLFPAPGCWEVTGAAGSNILTFITWVEAQ